MGAPTTWNAPSSGGTVSSTTASFHDVYHAGDYWFSVARTTNTTLTVRYAADPTGTWSTATLPAWPTGTTSITPMDSGGVQYDGTHYAFGVNTGGTAGARLYYATDPGSTWTDHDFGAGTTYDAQALLHDGSRWIVAGQYLAATPKPAFIGYTGAGSAVTSTYTFGTAVGYDPAGITGWTITALGYDGTHYVSAATRSPTSGINGHLRYATDITSTWSTPTTTQIEQTNRLQYDAGVDYWYNMGPNPRPYYAQDPTATWTVLGTASTGLTDEVLGLGYGDGYWVAGGRYSNPGALPGVSYLQASSPSGTYTVLTSGQHGFGTDSSQIVYTVAYHGGYWVAGSNLDCELRWCRTGATTPATLRQRQSPRRSPSRVGYPALRQRQSPFIR